MKLGIHSVEIAMPLGRMSVEGMSRDLGVRPSELLEEIGVFEKPVLEPGQEIFEYGLNAARQVLAGAKISKSDIGIVIFASCGVSRRQMWSPAAWIQNQLGAAGRYAFDLQNGCNSGNLALQVAGRLQEASERPFALVVVADALSAMIDYTDPTHKKYFCFADGAAAVLLAKADYKYEIGAFSSITKGEYADHIWWEKNSPKLFVREDEDESKLLVEEYRHEYPQRVRNVLAKEGLTVSQIDHVFMNQADHSLLNRLAAALTIPMATIHASYRHFGHIGGSDIFLALKEREKAGLIKKGQRIFLSTSGFGYSWGASLLTRV